MKIRLTGYFDWEQKAPETQDCGLEDRVYRILTHANPDMHIITGQGAPPMLNAWYVWDRQHVGETVLRMLDKVNPSQGEMF